MKVKKNGDGTSDLRGVRLWHIVLGIIVLALLVGGNVWNGVVKVQKIMEAPVKITALEEEQGKIVNYLGAMNTNIQLICHKLKIEPQKPFVLMAKGKGKDETNETKIAKERRSE